MLSSCIEVILCAVHCFYLWLEYQQVRLSFCKLRINIHQGQIQDLQRWWGRLQQAQSTSLHQEFSGRTPCGRSPRKAPWGFCPLSSEEGPKVEDLSDSSPLFPRHTASCGLDKPNFWSMGDGHQMRPCLYLPLKYISRWIWRTDSGTLLMAWPQTPLGHWIICRMLLKYAISNGGDTRLSVIVAGASGLAQIIKVLYVYVN